VHLKQLWLSEKSHKGIMRHRRDLEMEEFFKNFPRILPELQTYNCSSFNKEFRSTEKEINLGKLLRKPCALEECYVNFKKNIDM